MLRQFKDTGPFSQFNHITRSLTLLTGETIVLSIDGKHIELHKNTSPFSFDGSANTYLIECPLEGLDFGVMTHNQYATHTLVRKVLSHRETYQRQATTTHLLTLQPCIINNIFLNTFDSLLFTSEDESALTVETASLASASISLLITEIKTI